MRCSSSVVNPVVVTALLLTFFALPLTKNIFKKTYYFRYVDLAFPQLVSKILIQIGDISKTYTRKQRDTV